jgi:phosphatidylserine/phosphatidylglycerophosphate/cardiolipin synthase-like enzyme
MSTAAAGRVVDENGTGLSKLGVTIEDISRQFDISLNDTVTADSGSFSLSYAADLVTSASAGQQIRTLRLRFKVGQHILKEIVQVDQPATDTLTFPPITIARIDAESWWATLNGGQPSRLSEGNALSWLADNVDAWGRVADVIASAKTLDVMQLTVDIGAIKRDDSKTPPLQENPVVVLRFDGDNTPTADHTLALTAGDQRIETLLFAAEQRDVPVRIQIPRMAIDKHGAVIIGLVAGTIVAGFAAVMLLGGIVGLVVAGLVLVVGLLFTIRKLMKLEQVFDTMFSEPKLVNWFQTVEKFAHDTDANANLPAVRIRLLQMRSTMVTHAKMVNDRGVQGVLLGSPFEQDYFDSRDHLIDNPLRGASAGKGPIHDVSVGLRGPIVKDMHDLFKNHWDIADSSDMLPAIDAPTALTAAPDGEFLLPVQFVRTLDRMFTADGTGEAGVLEAYLRAIHFAQRFIYIENQYFNNDLITQALIDALKNQPDLVVILVLNVAPDMPFYPAWQHQAVRKIADSLGGPDASQARLGVFTVWSHAKSDATHGKPRLVDNYLHTKSALIDNRWASVGSANLDGASLNFVQYARPLLDGDVRNTEANVVVFDPAGSSSPAVDALRRRLWSEHFGISDSTSSELDDTPGKQWLTVWTQKAKEKVDNLKAELDQVTPARILPWVYASFDADARFKDKWNGHVIATPYLEYLLSPDDKPSDVQVSQFDLLADGPDSVTFTTAAAQP